jgi:hypothetical protein
MRSKVSGAKRGKEKLPAGIRIATVTGTFIQSINLSPSFTHLRYLQEGLMDFVTFALVLGRFRAAMVMTLPDRSL